MLQEFFVFNPVQIHDDMVIVNGLPKRFSAILLQPKLP